MACFVPFSNRNLDISLFAFRPTIVVVDHLVEALKRFSISTSKFGCAHSAILRSIHGNLVIWYGAWRKRSSENKESLDAALLSMLNNVSSMAILIDHCFYEAYAGQSRDGKPAAKFISGDIISIHSASFFSDEKSEKFAYAALAIFRSHFPKMKGSTAGVCMKCPSYPRIVGLCVWKSLHFCYSYILNSDYRDTVLPYVDGCRVDIKYDIFRVAYVSSEDTLLDSDHQLYPPSKLLQS